MKWWLVKLVILLGALALVGCGGDAADESGGGDTASSSSGSSGSSSSSSSGVDASSSSSGGDASSSSSSSSSSSGSDASSSSSSGDTASSSSSGSDSSGGGCTAGQTQCFGGNVQMCADGQFVTSETCGAAGCANGACNTGPLIPGTCNSPTPLPIDGTPINGTTDTTSNPNNWSQQCKEKYNSEVGAGFFDTTGPETVFQMNVPSAQYLAVTVEPSAADPTYIAFYIRGICNQVNSNVWDACKGNASLGSAVTHTQLFSAGAHDIIVDAFGTDSADVGAFTIKAEPVFIPTCGGDGGTITQQPTVLDASNGPDTRQDSTSNGDTQATISQSTQYCNVDPISSGRTFGNERIFAFALRERKNVSIQLSLPNPDVDPVGVYIRPDDCGETNVRDVQEREMVGVCAKADDSGPGIINKSLPPGAYFIFVDEHKSGATHDFELTLTLTD